MTSTPQLAVSSESPSLAHASSTTTRFYGVKYLEKKTGGDQQSSTTADKTESCHINPRQYFREVYGPFLCTLLLTSAFLVVLGSALMLAGYYVPRLSFKELIADNKVNHFEAIKAVEEHNATLSGLRIAGVVLLVVGAVGLCVLFLAPTVCLQRTEYSLLPDTEGVKPRSSFSSTASGLPEDLFTFSVVKQHIQPRKPGGGKTTRSTHQHRANYDKGFLSPELNRGPIFVSDESFKLRQLDGDDVESRFRSSSCEARGTRLSPQPPYRHKRSSSLFRIGGGMGINHHENLSTEPKKLISVKAGSFHSLHR